LRTLISAPELDHSPFGEWFLNDIHLGDHIEPVLFFHGGWGKVAAAASTQFIIDRWSPTMIINLGTCGGFEGKVEKGTIILANRTVIYDIIEQMGDQDEHIEHYATDLDIDWLGNNYPIPVLCTLLVSGDRDLIMEQVPFLHQKYGAVAGDWESGAIAWVATRNNVRCLILRGVSDLVGQSGGEAYGNIKLFEENTDGIMKVLFDSLPAWISRLNLRVHNETATHNYS
jgi:adenosylhomocysteine nucleosidase